VPSVPLDDPRFDRRSRPWGIRFIWRGPSSMNTNWFIVDGLRRHGYDAEADELVARSRELVERGGFNEFYDPIDGTPVGAANFGWATLAAVM
jgi:glycogen debranching enzyme